jgi:hypothetical protein
MNFLLYCIPIEITNFQISAVNLYLSCFFLEVTSGPFFFISYFKDALFKLPFTAVVLLATHLALC